MMRLWLRKAAAKTTHPPRASARNAAGSAFLRDLRFESLEARQLLSATASGYSPAQIRAAYGFNATSLTGAGTTIAIVDAYDDPNIAGDLRQFDARFGLPDPALVKESQSGGTSVMPAANSAWAAEIALDVEWAHAIAPAATILLVEANSASAGDLLAAVNTARHAPGVVAVSMSWGAVEFQGETSFDSYFTTPAGHSGVTFVAASGDSGAAVSYPAASPNVVPAGGTSLALDGGGNTGFAVYNSYGASGWDEYGGTSAAAPQWAALVALADEGRANLGLKSLDGPSQTLPLLYAMPAGNFHDITAGGSAAPGYDLATGRGTPRANLVISSFASATDFVSKANSPGPNAPPAINSVAVVFSPAIVLPPTNLTYSLNPATYKYNFPIANNVPSHGGGAVSSYSVSPALPSGLNLNLTTGVISGNATVTAAVANYTVTASNSVGSASVSLTITVTNPPPVLSNLPDQIFAVGSSITTLTFPNTGGAPSSCSASPPLPSGLSLTASNESVQIHGTPTVSSSALYTITATNASGSSTATVIITTSTNISLPTTINSGTNVTLIAGEVYPIDTTLTINGGSLDLGGTTQTVGSLMVDSGSLVDGSMQAGSVLLAGGSVSANLSSASTLTMNGSAAATLSGNNSYTGGIQVQAGSLVFSLAGALPNGQSITVGDASEFGAAEPTAPAAESLPDASSTAAVLSLAPVSEDGTRRVPATFPSTAIRLEAAAIKAKDIVFSGLSGNLFSDSAASAAAALWGMFDAQDQKHKPGYDLIHENPEAYAPGSPRG